MVKKSGNIIKIKKGTNGEFLTSEALLNMLEDLEKTNDKLEESEEKFRVIFEGASDGILVADIKTKKFNFANPQICKLTGYLLQELTNLSVKDIHPKKDLPYVMGQFEKQMKGKLSLARDIPILRKNKTVFYCDVNSRVVKMGKQKYLVGFFREITERKKAEEELRESKERLQFLVSSGPAVIYSSKAYDDFGATFISKNIKEQTGYKPEDFINNSNFWANNIHPDDQKRVFKDLKGAFKKGHSIHEYRFRFKDGKYYWMRDEFKIIKDAKGKPQEMIGYWININKQKEVENKILEKEQELRLKDTAIELSINAIAFSDNKGILTHVNNAFLKMWGYKNKKEVLGKPAVKFWKIEKKAKEVIKILKQKGGWIGELTAKRKDGLFFKVQLSASIIKDGFDKPYYMMASFVPILNGIDLKKKS